MQKLGILIAIFLVGCASLKVSPAYVYREMKTPHFTLAVWVKDTNPTAPFEIYIEGDGHAFTRQGLPASDPTPKGKMMRQLAFTNPAANVAYIARPCQFVTDPVCTVKDWTTGRFSIEAVQSMASAIKELAGTREVVLYGYSGGGLLGGLLIQNYPEIRIKKWITYAGLLNHTSWTKYKKLSPLTDSLDLEQLPAVPQVHYAGAKDTVIPLELSKEWTVGQKLVIIPNATHNGPFGS